MSKDCIFGFECREIKSATLYSMTNNKSKQLAAAITLPTAIALIISSIIGSGVYKKVAPMSDTLQSPMLVMICWLLGGLISLAGAISNAEVASLLAGTGGEYRYYRTIYGKFFAFIFGWASFAVIKTAAIASIAYVFTQSFNSLIPLPQLFPELADFNLFGVIYPFDNFSVKLFTALIIVLLTYVNIRGVKLGGQISKLLIVLVLLGIGTIVVFGMTSGQADWSRLTQNATGYVSPGWGGLVSGMFTAMLAAFWAYEGWNTIGYIGGEIQNPNRNLPIVLFWGVLAVITVYLLANITYLILLPIDQLIEIKRSTNSIAAVEAVKSFWGAGGGYFISVLILITTLASTHTTILLAARTYFAMAGEGVFFKGADEIHPTYQTPSKALVYQCIWACGLVFTGSFDQLTDMLIFASFLFYGATTFGVFVLRRTMPDAHRPYRVWGYPVVPIIFILFCIVLIGNTLINQPRDAFFGLALIASGLPFYYFWRKRDVND